MTTLIGAFSSCSEAVQVIDDLTRAGIDEDQLSVLVRTARLQASGATGRAAGALLAAAFAGLVVDLSGADDALGAGRLIRAMSTGTGTGTGTGLAARLIMLGLDWRTANDIEAAYRDGQIVLGAELDGDPVVNRAAARVFARADAWGLAQVRTPSSTQPARPARHHPCRSCESSYGYDVDIQCAICGRRLCSYCAVRSRAYVCPCCGAGVRR
jgi:hypothetical protein